ncbi:27736_t:CDS:1, partial [Dentiscutata erythropus]
KGDKVLLYDSRLDKQWSGKLDKRWKGPFTVEKRLDKESYILSNEFGNLKEPIYSDRLKLFRSRESWKPLIRI